MSVPEQATVELVRRAQLGEAEAREELFARYAERVLPIARVRLGARLRGALESTDILQEALLEALRGLERFEMTDESSLIRWLATLVDHRITARASYLGAAKRANASVSLDGETHSGKRLAHEPPATTPSPSAELEARERDGAVQQALAELPELYREIVLLRDYAGASWEEVARELAAPSAAAARMLHARALVKLGAALRARGVAPRGHTS